MMRYYCSGTKLKYLKRNKTMKNLTISKTKKAAINATREQYSHYNSKPISAARREARSNKSKRRDFYQQ